MEIRALKTNNLSIFLNKTYKHQVSYYAIVMKILEFLRLGLVSHLCANFASRLASKIIFKIIRDLVFMTIV